MHLGVYGELQREKPSSARSPVRTARADEAHINGGTDGGREPLQSPFIKNETNSLVKIEKFLKNTSYKIPANPAFML